MNTTFHADNFRPYKIPHDKPPSSSHNLPYPPRYPTPASLTEFPLAPNPARNPAHPSPPQPATQKHQHQHPLPARPPAEVCATTRSHRRSHRPPGRQTGRTTSEFIAFRPRPGDGPVLKSPSANSHSDVSAPTLQGQPLSPRDHGHHQAKDRHDFSNVPPGSPSFLEDAIDKVAPFPETTTIREDIPRLPEAQNTIPIDPAIVSGDATHEGIQLEQATADSSQVIDEGRDTARSSPDPLALDLHPIPECHRSVSKEAEPPRESITPRMIGSYGHGHDHRRNQHSHSDTMRVGIASSERDHDGDSPREGSTSGKRSSRTRQSLGRPAKRPRTGAAPHEGRGSFLTLRSHFFTLPFEERLQFLSWLFEGALSHCMPESLGAFNVSSTTGKTGTDDTQSVSPRTRPYGTAPTLNANDEPPRNLRKHRQWTSEEVDLLVKLRKEQKLPWSEVAKGFAEQFPGRTQGSIQVYWCTKLKDRH